MRNQSSSFWSPGIDLEYIKKNLPPGFRFKPEDYELLYYLQLKKEGHPDANIIKEIPQDKCNPDELEREFSNRNEDGWYFFTDAKQHSGNRVVRRAGNGTWKSGTGAKAITYGNRTVGYKTTLTFAYIQKGNKAKKTIFNMHEYRLLPDHSGKRKRSDNLVLCKIYKRRVTGKTYDDALDEENTSISSIANNATDVSIGSFNSRQSPTIVSKGSEQMLSDVSSTECVEIYHQFPEEEVHMDRMGGPDSGLVPHEDRWIPGQNPVPHSVQVAGLFPELSIEDVNFLEWLEGFFMDEEIGNDPRMFPEEELNHLEEELRKN